jgi:hypothetical protein
MRALLLPSFLVLSGLFYVCTEAAFAGLRLKETLAGLRLKFAELPPNFEEKFAGLRVDENCAGLRQKFEETFAGLRLKSRSLWILPYPSS